MAEGDIGAVIDSLEFDALHGESPHMIDIGSGVYAIVYVGNADKGLVITVEIADDGSLPLAPIDTLEFDVTYCRTPKIINVTGNIYAIVYQGVDGDGYLATVTIAPDGSIDNSVIDSWEYDELNGGEAKILKVASGVFVMDYVGLAGDGYLATVNIGNNGSITKSLLDTWEYETGDCMTPDLIHINGNIYAGIFSNAYVRGQMFTVEIASNGAITKSKIDALEYDPVWSVNAKIISISGDVYAIIHNGPDQDGWVYTIEITDAGAIGAAVIDSYEFDVTMGDLPWITLVSGNVYALTYQDSGYDGQLKTITIAVDGTITKTPIGALEFDTVDCVRSCIVHRGGNVYAIAYQGVDGDGWLKTIGIETISAAAIKHLQIIGVG